MKKSDLNRTLALVASGASTHDKLAALGYSHRALENGAGRRAIVRSGRTVTVKRWHEANEWIERLLRKLAAS